MIYRGLLVEIFAYWQQHMICAYQRESNTLKQANNTALLRNLQIIFLIFHFVRAMGKSLGERISGFYLFIWNKVFSMIYYNVLLSF